jgi:hypothetical protein
MKRSAKEQTPLTTFVAPHPTPEWLYYGGGPDIVVPTIEVDATILYSSDDFPDWMPMSEVSKKNYIETLSMQPSAANGIYFRGSTGRDGLEAELLQEIGVRHNGSPVWWVDLDDGPVQAASLFDVQKLSTKKQPWPHGSKKKKRVMWLLSLEQWESATYPPASKGGPPFVKGVSTAAERLRRRRKKG